MIELLASITIGTMLLGVAAMLLSSILHLSNSNSQSFTDRSAMKYTMTTLSMQLADSTQAVYYAGNSELRYKTGTGYKSAVFDSAGRTLVIYDFSNDGDPANDAAQFANGSISIRTNRSLYTNPVTLNKAVSSIAYKQAGGASVPAVPLKNGELITIDIVFQYQKVSLGGTRSVVPNAESTSVKLMVDSTSK
nr:hypothetical protein [Paenibacillus allorhizosphaerae]